MVAKDLSWTYFKVWVRKIQYTDQLFTVTVSKYKLQRVSETKNIIKFYRLRDCPFFFLLFLAISKRKGPGTWLKNFIWSWSTFGVSMSQIEWGGGQNDPFTQKYPLRTYKNSAVLVFSMFSWLMVKNWLLYENWRMYSCKIRSFIILHITIQKIFFHGSSSFYLWKTS